MNWDSLGREENPGSLDQQDQLDNQAHLEIKANLVPLDHKDPGESLVPKALRELQEKVGLLAPEDLMGNQDKQALRDNRVREVKLAPQVQPDNLGL